jgi:hypothetical protein
LWAGDEITKRRLRIKVSPMAIADHRETGSLPKQLIR